ncbi:choice-of-anchor J domain-containing protein [Massilia putida]|uniref:choice-of-anchor J domain-containing protein n=1 Tax=Massilia putida TaxID=1141883 RepID=UPI0009512B5D|nr:choice-of-anchor J domain-containing protein [Massilia putida]
MKPVNTLFTTAALALAALGASSARAAGVEVLNEGFDNMAALGGWAQVNDSIPAGNGWFQGNGALFPAQAGAPDAYAAANFLGAANGSGSVDNWLITPVLDLSGTTVLSFYTRHDTLPGFNDLLEVRYASGTGTDVAGFTTLLTTIGGTAGYPTDWQQFTAAVADSGSGRFAFRYLGPADTLNYIGLDTVSVVTAVPEPAHSMMLALGLGMRPLLRRQPRP